MNTQQRLAQLQAHLNLNPLNPIRAKREIILGLAAFSIGILLGVSIIVEAGRIGSPDFVWLASAFSMTTLGAHLAMAGQRSMLYQSMNKLTDWIVARLEPVDSGEGD